MVAGLFMKWPAALTITRSFHGLRGIEHMVIQMKDSQVFACYMLLSPSFEKSKHASTLHHQNFNLDICKVGRTVIWAYTACRYLVLPNICSCGFLKTKIISHWNWLIVNHKCLHKSTTDAFWRTIAFELFNALLSIISSGRWNPAPSRRM